MLASAMPDERGDMDLAHLAALARLQLTPDEEALYLKQLTGILAFVRQLQDVDTAGVPPTAQVLLPAIVERPDEVRPSLSATAALGNAPDSIPAPPLVRVPKVLG
jgi:aspartyl-tRNA(Asn)/glutamyl-tRNA(Gln) amidotransferase subunit C